MKKKIRIRYCPCSKSDCYLIAFALVLICQDIAIHRHIPQTPLNLRSRSSVSLRSPQSWLCDGMMSRDMVSSELLHLLVLQGRINILEYMLFLGYLSLSFLISKMVVVILLTLQSRVCAANVGNSASCPACCKDHSMSEFVPIHCCNKLPQKCGCKAIDIYSLLVLKCGESKPAPLEGPCPGP